MATERPSHRAGRRLSDVALCTVAAVLTFVSFPTAWAPALTFFPLIWLSHVPLLWVLRDKGPRAAFGWGLFTGTLINTGGYYWIADLLEIFGALPLPIAWLGMLLHSLYQGLIWAAWAWLLNRIGNTTRVGVQWTAPVVMVALELAVPRLFPAAMGNSQYLFPPIMQICDLFGVGAVTFLIYRVNAVLYLWLRARIEGRERPRRAALATALMLAASLVYGVVRMAQTDARMRAAPTLRIGIAEADVGIFQTETRPKIKDHLLILQHLSQRLAEAGAELVLWSESAYRFRFLRRDAARLRPSKVPLVDTADEDARRDTPVLDRAAPQRGFEVPLLFGLTTVLHGAAPRWEGDGTVTPYNTAFLLDRDGTIAGAYDKVFLLMFGEYVPFARFIPFFYDWVPAAGNLEPGRELKAITADLWGKGPIRFGVLICYEGILPSFVRPLGKQHPHLLVNLTNDDWFGKSAERYLHFALTVPRAIEHRLAFVRATLTGVSAFVDANGRVLQMTRPTDPETLLQEVPLLQSETVYQTIGDALSWACLALMLLWYAWGRLRRRSA
mgnify:CR=1 FL=1